MVACRPCRHCTRRGAEPQRHLFALPRGREPSQTPPSLATDSSISPGPPLSLAAGTDHRKVVLPVLRRNAGSHAQGTCLPRTINAAGGSGQGCRGRSPRRNKLWESPFPGGEGGRGGWGQESKLKARLAGSKQGKPPRRARGSPPFPCAARVQPSGMQGAKPLA